MPSRTHRSPETGPSDELTPAELVALLMAHLGGLEHQDSGRYALGGGEAWTGWAAVRHLDRLGLITQEVGASPLVYQATRAGRQVLERHLVKAAGRLVLERHLDETTAARFEGSAG